MGGPKDEEPPILLYSNPPDQSTNIKPSEIDLEFNEFVKIENPNQSVIITPRLEKDKIEYLAIKNRINININQDLEDNTTYLFNFQKSVQDITESNPANRLKLVFSTGESIDSLSVSGQVAFTDPYAELEFDDVLVGLYAADDTTDLFTAPPYYIAQPDSTGRFEITNIKAGEFRAYAWHDENNSLKAEYRNEAYGFAPDIISVDTNKEGLFINIAKGDLSDLKINRGTITGRNFDIVLSKPIAEFSVSHPDKNKQLFYRIQDKTIRLYHTEMRNDSTEIGLLLKDSVGFLVDTTFYATFEESDRSKEKLEITTNTGLKFVNTIQAKLHFNKPIVDINYDSLYLKYDSARLIPILPEMVRLPDSTHLRTDIFIDIPLPDTVSNNAFTLYASDSTFRDAEDMWNEDPVEAKYTRLKTDNLADGINGKINTPERPIILQLLNSKGEIIQEKYLLDTNYFEFNNIEATNYSIQAIIDKNENGRWDPGNYYQNIQPEPIYAFFDEETKKYEFILRGGWTLDGLIIERRNSSGFIEDQNKPDLIDNIRLPIEIMEIDPEDLHN
ncbi:Ig-like domain-containing protein [Cyclobacterium lianum]|uniref:Ig-like domain-containing protein n=2 Tax=Cyclobacterium lianum TaxID=388280 RepID=A0A1M7HS26_9BACT|nr:Ig-like domain-containing protein [Cyclobacterium lianum]